MPNKPNASDVCNIMEDVARILNDELAPVGWKKYMFSEQGKAKAVAFGKWISHYKTNDDFDEIEETWRVYPSDQAGHGDGADEFLYPAVAYWDGNGDLVLGVANHGSYRIPSSAWSTMPSGDFGNIEEVG